MVGSGGRSDIGRDSLHPRKAERQNRPAAPEAITGRGDPRGMTPVRRTGAEVTTTFWAMLTGHRAGLLGFPVRDRAW